MSYDDAMFEGILAVMDLDLPDDAYPGAFLTQAALLSGLDSDDASKD